jgi:GTPase
MQNKIVAILGRPNVGKSTLFNRLIGKRIAIVHDKPGVTRDRNYGEVEWNGRKFFLIDTGGYVPDSDDKFEAAIREQVIISIEEADLILLVVDAKSGITALDIEIGKLLRKRSETPKEDKNKNSKKVLLVLNKVDRKEIGEQRSEFYKLGLGEPLEVSALIGRSSGDLLDEIVNKLEFTDDSQEQDSALCKIAVIGRPNAGKSSIVNSITQTNRNIVTDIPGTTRDSIDTVVKYYGQDIILIDTAGLRKKSRIRKAESLEYYSAIRTQKSIERCDVALLIIDATTILEKFKNVTDFNDAIFKLGKEDVSIINDAADMKKGILIVVNKWDLISKQSDTAKIFEDKIKEHLKTFEYLPLIFVSALTSQRISKVLEAALKVFKERAKEIQTSKLNNVLGKIIDETPPVGQSRREIKINYITQLKTSPPVIGFFTNLPSEIEENYKRFLEHKIRLYFGFEGVPVTLVFKKKN